MLGPDDIVLCAGTLIHASLREAVAAASASGYSALSVGPEDIEGARAEGLSDSDIRALFEDNGLQIAELDPLLSWLHSGSLGKGAIDDSAPRLGRDESEFFALADTFGGSLINCAHPFPGDVDLDEAAEAFAGLCDRAREHGTRCAIEFLPWTGIPDVTTAAEIVRRAGRTNGGIMFDTWHHFRGANDDEALRQVPGEFIHGVQVNSAPSAPSGEPMIESMHERLLPDEGDIDVANLIRILDSIGSRAAIGIEVFSNTLNALPANQTAQLCIEATRRVVTRART